MHVLYVRYWLHSELQNSNFLNSYLDHQTSSHTINIDMLNKEILKLKEKIKPNLEVKLARDISTSFKLFPNAVWKRKTDNENFPKM